MNRSASADETVCVQLTPVGRSAIAVVAVAGPRAVDAVDACFQAANGQCLASQLTNAIRFGHWRGEELIVCHRSTTGDEVPLVEVHCHGGHAAVRAVLDSLVEQDCREIEWREWISRHASSALEAEARAALASSQTERTAGVLLDQLDGALQRDLQTALAAFDRSDASAALAIVDTLIDRAAVGRHLTTPWRVLLAGPPNVGKSSLMNALVGYRRAVVYDQPGTTRDVVTASTAVDGWPVEFLDTAGIRNTADELEAASIALAKSLLASADLVLVVAEAAADCEPLWQATEAQIPAGVAQLRVVSKSDLVPAVSCLPHAIATSATTGDGIQTLLSAIGARLVPAPPPAGAAVPFTRRHHEQLIRSREALHVGDFPAARESLHAMLAVNSGDLLSS